MEKGINLLNYITTSFQLLHNT